ncbi:hypothetical protein NL676_016344 [Syzygium grande]|nr:hypothetical protein NL676_016344 [Syzygium grande]
MALETWVIKVKTAISHGLDAVKSGAPHPKLAGNKKRSVGILAFEIAGLMSKLLHLWQSLSDKNVVRLCNESVSLEGVRKIVSNDEAFLLGLACAEMVESLRHVARAVGVLGKRCEDSNLWDFERFLGEFANTGRDSNHWSLSNKDMEILMKKMDRYVTATTTLHREMEELSILESSLRKSLQLHEQQHDSSLLSLSLSVKEQKIIELQQKIMLQKQEIKCLREKSLWNRSFDSVTLTLATCIFTNLARIKLVFGLGNRYIIVNPSSLPRSLSASAAVHPSENPNHFIPGPLRSTKQEDHLKTDTDDSSANAFFESNSKLLKPPATTLGAAALALHYANLIIVMERMIKSPQLVGADARDDLYAMLPSSVRLALRARLRGVGICRAGDPALASEWRDALTRILGWLAPLAHNMIKWQSERSIEQQNSDLVQRTNVYLLQTLYFANTEKTEAAITELLVGLNYIWRFEREMTAKALFECTNLGGLINVPVVYT